MFPAFGLKCTIWLTILVATLKHKALITIKKNAFVYATKLVTGSVIVWYSLRAFNVPHPYWALLSLIIVTEPELALAKQKYRARVINTITGTVVAGLCIVTLGASFATLLLAMTVAVMVAMTVESYPGNWRNAPNTAVILMAAALEGANLPAEVRLAGMRVLEVLVGSTVALLQTFVYTAAFGRWITTKEPGASGGGDD